MDSSACDECPILEPFVGMEFDSEESAKEFYDEFARRVGFVIRVDQCRRSEIDKRILSRRFSCNRQGFYVKNTDQFGPTRKPRASMREGCKAMMLVKVDKSGKWVITRFVKEHTHSMTVSTRSSQNSMDSKDLRIQELTMELERQDRLCALYRDLIITVLKNIEDQTDHLTTKIGIVVDTIRDFENKAKKLSST